MHRQAARHHSCFNDTNLHTHGLWISPSGHSDNVLPLHRAGRPIFDTNMTFLPTIPPGPSGIIRMRHGAGFAQVGSGMAGALIVTGNRLPTASSPGDVDILLKDERGRPFPERVMVFQHIKYGCMDGKGRIEGQRDKEDNPLRPFTLLARRGLGRIESFDNDWGWRRSGRFAGINGKVEPQLSDAKAGGFERWRLINAGTGEPMRMRLYRLDPAAPAAAHGKGRRADRMASSAIALASRCRCGRSPRMAGLQPRPARSTRRSGFPGQRVDVIARLPEQGLYCMVNDTGPDNLEHDNPPRMMAVIGAKGAAAAQVDSEALLLSTLVHSAEKALAGNEQSETRSLVIADLKDGLKLSAFDWHKPIQEAEVSGYREIILNIIEGHNCRVPSE